MHHDVSSSLSFDFPIAFSNNRNTHVLICLFVIRSLLVLTQGNTELWKRKNIKAQSHFFL
jgi:hypothetical protein